MKDSHRLDEGRNSHTFPSQDNKSRWENISAATNILLAVVALAQVFLVVHANKSARISAEAAVRAAETSTQANNLSRQALVADQRPWIAVSIEAAGPITWISKGMQVPFKITLKNIGKSPALNLRHVEDIALALDANLLGDQASLRQLITSRPLGAINLMPGEEVQQIGYAQKTETQVTAAQARWAGSGPKLVKLVLLGAAVYNTSFDDEVRTTGFIYEVGIWDPTRDHTITGIAPGVGGAISQDRIRIRRRPDIDAPVT